MTPPVTTPPLDFVLPPGRGATARPESRGRARDDVRLLVARPHALTHGRFRDLPHHLHPGDLVVVNTSATLPAALDGTWHDRPVVLHLSSRLDDGHWVVEVRRPDARGPVWDARAGDLVVLTGGASARLVAPDGDHGPRGVRLWVAEVTTPTTVVAHLQEHGRPIVYAHLAERPGLEAFQTVFARHPGSAEMASAGRPFTLPLVAELVTRGITLAPVTLHAGVSSLEPGEPPRPERFAVPEVTARLVNDARRSGGRVVAVGTTVTRALESAAGPDGRVRVRKGWTDLVLGPARPARVVDGLVTGWHEPGGSHLRLLEAVAGRDLVARAYAAALAGPYLWHEFGDSTLLLP